MNTKTQSGMNRSATGKVYLIGAGPGDPELLTVKALRLLRTAEAVLHDDLVAPEILRLIPPSAQIHNVGKRCGKKQILQHEINGLMVALGAAGLRVIRLKGGDPLIFGRVGEEIEELRAANIPFEIIPGVTSALGAAASAQIPLTHRRASSALTLITAHRAPRKGAPDSRSSDSSRNDSRQNDSRPNDSRPNDFRSEDFLANEPDWSAFVATGATLVIYMPGRDYAQIARKLIAAGLEPRTPCAIISRATTRDQKTHRTTVLNLNRAPQLPAPTILIVGKVVDLADAAAMVSEFHLSSENAAQFPQPIFPTLSMSTPQEPLP
jgi:uroporphyrin-III C-methyltransferase